jgi:hypothetical protein
LLRWQGNNGCLFIFSGQIEGFVLDWIDLYFPGNGALLTRAVDLAKGCRGLIGRDILQILFEFGGDISAKQVTSGCRLILEHLLSDLLEIAHQVWIKLKISIYQKSTWSNQ